MQEVLLEGDEWPDMVGAGCSLDRSRSSQKACTFQANDRLTLGICSLWLRAMEEKGMYTKPTGLLNSNRVTGSETVFALKLCHNEPNILRLAKF